MSKLLTSACVLLLAASAFAGTTTVDFEDLMLANESYWNGSDLSGGFTSRGVWFDNNYNATYGSWDGFAYSNIHDVTTSGYGNQYAAYSSLGGSPAGGYGGAGNYAVSYVNAWGSAPVLNLPYDTTVIGGLFTNTTYAALSMLYGDAFAKKFGGAAGSDPDWFLLTVTGHDAADGAGNVTGSLTFYLADYSDQFGGDWVLDDWTWFNLQPLGDVRSLTFALASSDVGLYGMNTPAYFALDNMVYEVPEPATVCLLVFGGGLALLKRRRRKD